jgi:hypothetical protein
MSTAQWFINQNEKVTGPLTTDEVKARFTGGQLNNECLIWGRILESWMTLPNWMRDLTQLTAATQLQAQPSAAQMWHYAIDGDSKGPMTRVEMINEIKNSRSSGEILVWTKGMKAWSDLYEFHDLLDEAGINRREHPRAPITGSVVVKFDAQTLIGTLKSISPGGFGATQLSAQLSIGQIVHVEIKSDSLPMPISLKSIVQYTSESGFFGFRFQNVSMEAKAHIMEYIKHTKSANPTANTTQQAA